MTPTQVKALIDYIDAAIAQGIEQHLDNWHENDGIWRGGSPAQNKYEAEDRLRHEFEGS